jgi:hypothetical protein
MTWTYRSEIFQEELIQDHIGFVYIITNLSNNRKYVGKKFFTKAASRQVKGKKKKIRVKSDWIDYFGSNEELKEEVKNLGGDNFHREIIHLCKTKAECSYRESYEIFIRDALLKEEYYNSWISCRIHKKHVIGKVSHGS